MFFGYVAYHLIDTLAAEKPFDPRDDVAFEVRDACGFQEIFVVEFVGEIRVLFVLRLVVIDKNTDARFKQCFFIF